MSDSEFVDNIESDDSEYDYLPGYELEVEPSEENPRQEEHESYSEGASGPYADEPIASDEWITTYEKDREEKEAFRRELQGRLNGVNVLSRYCPNPYDARHILEFDFLLLCILGVSVGIAK